MKTVISYLLLFFSLLAFPGFVTAQLSEYTNRKTASGKVKKLYDKAMDYNMQGKNREAIEMFEKVLKLDETFIDAQIQWAALKYELDMLPEAEKGFERVLEIDPAYKPKVFYTLAITELKMNKFSEAADHFQAFLESDSTNKILREKAGRLIDNCRFMGEALANPVPYHPINLGENINTTNAEYLPSLTADGQTLVYTVKIRGQEDFYVSEKINGEWQKGQPIDEINTNLNEGAQSLSADGKLIVFTVCDRRDGYGSCDLYFSEVRDGRWTPSENIGSPINSRSWESQPSVSADGSSIFYSSNRAGGLGGKDLWVSHRKSDGSWGTPQNLGDSINTVMDEQAPFIHPDGQTLYFMSNGHPGMGGHDLFYSRKRPDGKWGKPKNLGYPINTKDSEGALVISLDGKTAYFASDRKITNDGMVSSFDDPIRGTQTDIYQFELYEEARPLPVTYVKANVYDALTEDKLIAKVEFVDLSTGKIHTSSLTDRDGEFLVCLPLGKDYSLNVSKEKYLFHSENFALANERSLEKPYLLDISLQPIPDKTATADNGLPKSKPIVLKNVFFETAKADLRPESITELNRLKRLLEENPELRIQLNGHTDNVGSDEDNLKLSNDRAQAVYNYLVANGIAAERLKYKGFGETVPVDDNNTEAGRQRNRRTEFIIIN